jgi:iron-sulfur cluster repair protein YtfE (RIC family)
VYDALVDELLIHMMKEEPVLFPMMRRLAEGQENTLFPRFRSGARR